MSFCILRYFWVLSAGYSDLEIDTGKMFCKQSTSQLKLYETFTRCRPHTVSPTMWVQDFLFLFFYLLQDLIYFSYKLSRFDIKHLYQNFLLQLFNRPRQFPSMHNTLSKIQD